MEYLSGQMEYLAGQMEYLAGLMEYLRRQVLHLARVMGHLAGQMDSFSPCGLEILPGSRQASPDQVARLLISPADFLRFYR